MKTAGQIWDLALRCDSVKLVNASITPSAASLLRLLRAFYPLSYLCVGLDCDQEAKLQTPRPVQYPLVRLTDILQRERLRRLLIKEF